MVLRAENLSRQYFRRSGQSNYFYAVKDVSLALESGQVAVLMGRSGSGKTTLLNMLSGLLTPSSGKVWLGETDLYALDDQALSKLRNRSLGVIPQARSAVDTLTVMENIQLPGGMYGASTADATEYMAALGIEHLSDARPAELSGGEIRRMAIVRALCQSTDVILADEPTGDLDDENTDRVLKLLRDAAHVGQRAVLIVSHDAATTEYADAIWRMDGGNLSRK